MYRRAFRFTSSLRCGIASVSVLSLLAVTGSAAQAQIVNGSFEIPVVAAGGFQSFAGGDNMGGWTVLGNSTAVTVLSTTYGEPENGVAQFAAQQGNQSLDITGPGNNGLTSGIQQSVTTIAGQAYQLSFFVGRAISTTNSGFYQGPALLDLSINSGSRVTFSNSNTTANAGNLNWQNFTFNFTATGPATTIAFFSGTASGSQNEVGLDNITLNATGAAAPEPSALAFLVPGLVSLVGVGLRRRR